MRQTPIRLLPKLPPGLWSGIAIQQPLHGVKGLPPSPTLSREPPSFFPRLFALVVAAGGFAIDVFHHFGGARGLQIGGHAAQGHTENIAVMQFRSWTDR